MSERAGPVIDVATVSPVWNHPAFVAIYRCPIEGGPIRIRRESHPLAVHFSNGRRERCIIRGIFLMRQGRRILSNVVIDVQTAKGPLREDADRLYTGVRRGG